MKQEAEGAKCVEGENCPNRPIWFPFTDPKKGVCMDHYEQNHMGEISFWSGREK